MDAAGAARRARAALERLRDADTLPAARLELRRLAELVPAAAAGGFLEALLAAAKRPVAGDGAAARAAALAALAALARAKGRQLQPLLPKALAVLLRHFKDGGNEAVAGECVDAFAALAANVVGGTGGELQALVRPLLEALHDSDPVVQGTACRCLVSVCRAGGAFEGAHAISTARGAACAAAAFPKLLRCAERPVFGARREAMDALAALAAAGAAGHCGALVRLAVAALRDGQDFAVRRTGAQLLVAATRAQPGEMLQHAEAARAALQEARSDRIKHVRDAVAEALKVVVLGPGAPAGSTGNGNHGDVAAAAPPFVASRRPRSALAMKPNDAFFAQRDVPLVVAALPREEAAVVLHAAVEEATQQKYPPPPVAEAAQAALASATGRDGGDETPEVAPPAAELGQPLAAAAVPPEAHVAPTAPLQLGGVAPNDAADILVELRRLAAQQDELLDMLAEFSASTQRSISRVEARVDTLEGQVRNFVGGGKAPPSALTSPSASVGQASGTLWQRCAYQLERGNIGAAFAEAINGHGESALVRLLGRVDPCLHQVEPAMGASLVNKLARMVLEDTHADVAISWLAQVGVVPLPLEGEAKADLLAALDGFGRKYAGPGGAQARLEFERLARAFAS